MRAARRRRYALAAGGASRKARRQCLGEAVDRQVRPSATDGHQTTVQAVCRYETTDRIRDVGMLSCAPAEPHALGCGRLYER